jgi:hypothetical protein
MILYSVRRTLRGHEGLYYLVCAFRRIVLRKEAALANRCSALCIEGYQSSGNSFALQAVREAWPDLSVASHRHCVAAVKRALNLKVPTIILIREPQEAISSYVVRFKVPVDRAIREYCDFYGWVDTCSGLVLIDFGVLLARTEILLEAVGSLIGKPIPGTAERHRAKIYQDNISARMKSSNVQPAQWWVPHPEKEMMKTRVKAELCKAATELNEAVVIYQQLFARSRTQLMGEYPR